jgi:endonuclease V-like protein UPF0215 family
MARRTITHVIGFDDTPFSPSHRGLVRVIGAIFCRFRLEGVILGKVWRDGRNSTAVLAELVDQSRYRAHLQCIMLQGIALAGFNVVDIQRLSQITALPVITLTRHPPDMAAIRTALLQHVPGGRAKWRLIEKAGPIQPAAGLYLQRVGIALQDAERLIVELAINSRIPEPLRTAHIIASGLSDLPSHKRV